LLFKPWNIFDGRLSKRFYQDHMDNYTTPKTSTYPLMAEEQETIGQQATMLQNEYSKKSAT